MEGKSGILSETEGKRRLAKKTSVAYGSRASIAATRGSVSVRPFETVRILDLTHVLAGPFCTYQLALLGAEVIKIEAPDAPDMARGRGAAPALNAQGLGLNYQVQGGNKRALALDLKTPQGQDLFLRLVETADVVVQNYRVGALDALGLDAKTLQARNPQIIVCSITGFDSQGSWAGRNAYDNVIQAASGIMAATGAPDAPVKTAASMIDYATGMSAAFAIASALHQRALTGSGQFIDCAMFETALMFSAPEIAAELYQGQRGAATKEAGLGLYQTRQGQLMLGAFNVRQNRRLWTLLDRDDLAALDSWEALWSRADEMRAVLTTRMLERTAAQWETELNMIGVPAQRVRDLGQALDLAQTAAPTYLTATDAGLPGAPCVTVPLSPFRFDHHGPQLRSPPPRLGQDTDAVLTELGLEAAELSRLRYLRVVA